MKRTSPAPLRTIKAIKEPGLHPVGGNLYLRVSPSGAGRAWVFRYFHNGKRRHMGLGSESVTDVVEARDKVAELLKGLRDGVDPLDQKRAGRGEGAGITFAEVMEQYLAKQSVTWKAGAERAWRLEADKYLARSLGPVAIALVDQDAILKVLRPEWTEKTVTMMRVRGKVEAVLNYATAAEYRRGDNPAVWKGRLEHLLAAPAKVAKVTHVAALKPEAVPGFVAELRKVDKASAQLAEFTILTAARADEARLATWGEIDLAAKVWTVPAARMKAGGDGEHGEHVVPLSPAALKLLQRMKGARTSGYIFAGSDGHKALGHAAALETIKKVSGDASLTLHGFRSAFRDWAGDLTAHPRDVVEGCLAHAVAGKTERAYRRSDALEKRRAVMADWARFLDAPIGGAVVPIARRA